MMKKRNSLFWVSLFSLSLTILAGCATASKGSFDLLEFLEVGITSKNELIKKLGEPSAKFEGDKIFTYRLEEDKGGYLLSEDNTKWGNYSLVLVFDDVGILRRHELINIKEKILKTEQRQ